MNVVNMHEAKTHLSRLVQRAAAGEEVIIGRAGEPLVRLVPYTDEPVARTPGSMAGRIAMDPGFDTTPEWVIDAFEGRSGSA